MDTNIKVLLNKLEEAQSYEEWLHTSKQLDDAEHNEEWRRRDESEYYDCEELTYVLQQLREARLEHNISKLLYLVRTTFSRDIANMGDPRLYTQARSGTKYLIEEFINECELVLKTIVNDTDDSLEPSWFEDEGKHSNSASTVPGDYYAYEEQSKYSDDEYAPDDLIHKQESKTANGSPLTDAPSARSTTGGKRMNIHNSRKKIADTLQILTETRKAFGRTALVFSGGSILGFLHAGVTKELIKSHLLPNIISGSSSGSIFASVFCTRKDEEFDKVWELLHIPMNIFEQTGNEESFMTHLKRFLTLGTWIDSSFLKELMRKLIGDITFREAFNRTGRVLNVTVSVAGSHDMPRLLNYLTAPNVVIWSAVVCSCSVPLVFAADTIFAKDPKTKNIYPWSNGHFIDGSVDNDMPLGRLTEMFNINHFVACQVNPHIAPLFRDVPHVDDTPKDSGDSAPAMETMECSPSENTQLATASSASNPSQQKPKQPCVAPSNPSQQNRSKFSLYGLYENTIASPINWIQQKIHSGIRLGQGLVLNEVQHNLMIMKKSGLGASAATVALNVMNQDYWGDINIVPSIRWGDVGHLFKNPTSEQIDDLVHRGQQATWSKVSIIRNHCAVELALDKAIYELNSRLVSIVGAEHHNYQPHRLITPHTPPLVSSSHRHHTNLHAHPQHHHNLNHFLHHTNSGQQLWKSPLDSKRRRKSSFLSPVRWPSPVNNEHDKASRSKSVTNIPPPKSRKSRSASVVNMQ